MITTVAGTGTYGNSGDGGPATAALIGANSICVDASGNLYVADSLNSRIRRVSTAGIISTIAGTGTPGFSGDGGPAVFAQLNGPTIAVDSSANLYVADGGNRRIRRITPTGIITTIAGTGAAGFSRDGVIASAAQLNFPMMPVVDRFGTVFFVDSDCSSGACVAFVRKIDVNGLIRTVARSGGIGMAVDSNGNLFFGDYANGVIQKVTPAGIVTTVQHIAKPLGIAMDSFGTLFVVDGSAMVVKNFIPDGSAAIIAGNGPPGSPDSGDGGPATGASLLEPSALTSDSVGNVFVASTSRVRKLLRAQFPSGGCTYAIDSLIQNWIPAGGSSTVGVLASDYNCPWLSGTNAAWIVTNSAMSQTGTGLVSYTVLANANSASRSGTVWVGGKALTVSQEGVTCSLSVSPRSVTLSAGGATGSIAFVTSNVDDCKWSAVTSAPWILVSSGASGSGTGTVKFTAGVNTGGLRTGSMTVAGHTLYVNQAGPSDSISSLAGITANGVVNAASNAPLIAPGAFVTIYGQNFANGSTGWDSAIVGGRLPTSLGGVQVLVNGKAGFMNYVQSGQINVLAPADTTTGSVDVDVITARGVAATTVTTAATSPAFFTYSIQGAAHAAALFANEATYVAPVGAVAGVTSRPAKPGDYVLLYATGLGQTKPAYPVGQVLTTAYPIADLSQVRVLVGGVPAPLQFAGITFAGVFQVNIQIPAGVAVGDLPVVLQVGGLLAPQSAVLTIGQ